MQCSEAEALLPELHAGELEEAQAERLHQHLAGCASCRAALEEVGDGWGAVQRLAELDARDAVPAADVSAWLPAPPRRSPVWLEGLTRLARAAVLVLAGFGAASLLRPAPAPEADPNAAVEAMAAALEQNLRPMFTDLAVWMQQRERQDVGERDRLQHEFGSLMARLDQWVRQHDHKDLQYLAALHATRRDLDQTQQELALTQLDFVRAMQPLEAPEDRKGN